MSFGGGGFGGFGQSNQNQSSGFGGFGASNNTGGFGSSNQNTGAFGSNNTGGGSIFGGGTGAGGFGSNNTTSAFGQQNKPAFGSGTTTGGGIFGNNASNNASNTGSGFGSSGGFGNSGSGFGAAPQTGSNLFANQNKTPFGGSSTGSGLFGGTPATSTTGAFGASSTPSSGLFSQPQATAFGGVPECQGTGGTPFQAFQEKEANSATTNHFQSIVFMTPYKNYSFEELRVADYNKGQKHGNQGGGAGAFGQSTGFGTGGFGQSSTGAFGSGGTGSSLFNSNTTSSSGGFGSSTATAGAFGSNAGSGLFGQSKPASTTLFGSTNTSNTGTGPFGGGGGSAPFGQTQNQPTGSGLFGSNNATQQKPGGLFGNTSTPAGGFGSGSGAFGSSTTTNNLFGNNNQQPPTGGGVFGSQTQQSNNPFGTNTSGFNQQNQQKPGSLFGGQPANQAGSSLFGNTGSQQNQGGSLFSNTTQQPAGGLFGNNNNQQKPNSLFGTGTNTGSGLFGGGQQQQNQGSGLFGNTNTNQQNNSVGGGSLFGNSQQQNAGNSLFGNSQQQNQAGSSLFGNQAGNSILGNPQQQQNPLQAPSGFTASLSDPSPYGSASIFNGLPPPPQVGTGPIATPISAGSVRAKKPAALPQYKLNPAMASRLATPQKRGYGFSYSTYGTPSSASSVASTPGGLSSSLLGGSLSRSLGKSFSTSNLRNQFDSEGSTSLLSPGAFTASNQRYSAGGSLKRLTIDRSLRTDLFSSQPLAALPAAPSQKPAEDIRHISSLKKKVSFDTPGPSSDDATNAQADPTADRESATPTPQEQGYLRSSSRTNGRKSLPTQPEMEQLRGNELAIVHEDDSPEAPARQPKPKNLFDQADPQPGAYYTVPPIADLKKMSRQELKSLSGFRIGRENCGFVDFDEPVDLTTVDLDNLFENIAIITVRSLTIYPENAYKPPVHKGLNVPATVTLENSWPRGRDRRSPSYEKSGARFNKHIDRLKRVADTVFVDYNKDTGEWIFKVPHFTTYGLEYEDEDESMAEPSFNESTISEAPPSPTPKGKQQVRKTPKPSTEVPPSSSALSSVPSDMMSLDFDDSQVSSTPGDDTFGYRSAKRFPGAFDDIPAFEGSDGEDSSTAMVEDGRRLFDDRLLTTASVQSEDEPEEIPQIALPSSGPVALVHEEDLTMAGSFPDVGPESDEEMSRFSAMGSPIKLIPDINGDWADRLQRTISPRKQERQFLKQSQALLDHNDSLVDLDTTPQAGKSLKQNNQDLGEIRTSVDLMRSLFGKEEFRRSRQSEAGSGFQWPYKRRSTDPNQTEMSEEDIAFHESFKPSFVHGNDIVLRSGTIDVAIRKLAGHAQDHSLSDFQRFREQSTISVKNGVPAADFKPKTFTHFSDYRVYDNDEEQTVWQLLHVLFDDYEDEISKSIPSSERPRYAHRIRKDRLSEFWAKLCEPAATNALHSVESAEEKAIAYLSMHKIVEACNALADGGDYRLATLTAQVGGDEIQRREMHEQLDQWKRFNVISEMTEPIRALYSLIAGETCFCAGKQGPVEDRARDFIISKHFNMDWKRSFGLKLWYGILPEDSIETAIKNFADDLASQKEMKPPMPSFLESDTNETSNWADPDPSSRRDALWTILSLIAEQNQPAAKTKLPAALSPENVVGTPTAHRLSFELNQMLAPRFSRAVDPAQADALTVAFAAELETLGNWQYVLFILMFLDDPSSRKKALQGALARLAPQIDESNAENLQAVLFNGMKIPQSWFWDAKALQARHAGDKPAEVMFLARGHNWVEAHRVLCEDVAPLAVVERNHAKLRMVIDTFPARQISEWRLGGQVFENYLALVDGKLGRPEQSVIVENLMGALAELKPKPGDRKKLSFVQNVALIEMSRAVSEKANVAEADGGEAVRLLGLPADEEMKRQSAVELGLRYYKAMMAHRKSLGKDG